MKPIDKIKNQGEPDDKNEKGHALEIRRFNKDKSKTNSINNLMKMVVCMNFVDRAMLNIH